MKELAPLFPLVQGSLEYGTYRAREFFKQHETEALKKIDPYLASTIVRFYARDYLRSAEGQGESLANLPSIANIGLHIKYGSYQVKILKSSDGDIPVPGHSKSRRDYYDQQHLDLFMGDVDSQPPLPVNLLLLWSVHEQYELGVLSLACPKSGGITKDSVSAFWHCQIPQKLFHSGIDPNLEISSEEILDLQIEDIRIDEDSMNIEA